MGDKTPTLTGPESKIIEWPGKRADEPIGTKMRTAAPAAADHLVLTNRIAMDRARRIVGLKSPKAVLNQSRGLVAEVIAKQWVEATYGARAKLRKAITRSNGVDVLDLVFETGPNEFVVVEAKSHFSGLSATADEIKMVDPSGASTIAKVSGNVEQMSPKWFEQRLAELEQIGGEEGKLLAAELRNSWHSGGLRPLVVRAPVDPKTTELVFQIYDLAGQYNKEANVVATHRLPADRAPVPGGTAVSQGIARNSVRTPEEIQKTIEVNKLKGELTQAERAAKAAKEAAAKAAKAVDKTQGYVATAERNLAKIVRDPDARADRTAKLAKRQAELAEARTRALAAREAANRAVQAEQTLAAQVKAGEKELYRLRAARPEPTIKTPIPGPPGSTPHVAPGNATTHSRGTDPADGFSRGTESAEGGTAATSEPSKAATPEPHHAPSSPHAPVSSTPGASATAGSSAAAGVEAVPSTPHVSTAARVAEAERRIEKGARLLRALSMTKTVGKIAIQLMVPISALDWALELALYLRAWDEDRRQKPAREVARVMEFVFGVADTVPDPFVKFYMPSIGTWFWGEVRGQIDAERGEFNMAHWVERWDANKTWTGFAYAHVAADFIRSEHTPNGAAKKAPYPIRYFAGSVVPHFSDWSKASDRTVTERNVRTLQPQDSENMFTHGVVGDPMNWSDDVSLRTDYLYRQVRQSIVTVEITFPTPVVTPFDILAFKCRDLQTEVLRFISKFDENFMVTSPYTQSGFFTTYWYEGVQFPAPIKSRQAHLGLRALFDLAAELDTHPAKKNEPVSIAWERRQRLAEHYSQANRLRPVREIANSLYALASDKEVFASYRPNQDPELGYLRTQTLYDAALSIEEGFTRIHDAMTRDLKSPKSFEYRYTGTKE